LNKLIFTDILVPTTPAASRAIREITIPHQYAKYLGSNNKDPK
jgi:hypothetical protein